MQRGDHGNGAGALTMTKRLFGTAAQHPRLAALVLGAVAATGFAPFGLWPLTLLCLAGLIALLACTANGWRAALLGYAFGVGHFTVGLNWIAHAFTYQDAMPHWFGFGAVFLLSLYLAVFPAMATGLAVWLSGRREDARILCLAGTWAVSEYLRATLFTGFAWRREGRAPDRHLWPGGIVPAGRRRAEDAGERPVPRGRGDIRPAPRDRARRPRPHQPAHPTGPRNPRGPAQYRPGREI
jgi:hypothetical protein